MKLNLKEHVTKDDVAEHFELFKEAYVYGEFSGEDDPMVDAVQWFNDNAPWFLPVLDRWVINHIRANA